MTPINFHAMMAARQAKLGHALCVGLDPNLSMIPDKYMETRLLPNQRILWWMKDVIDETAGCATCFKPQMGYFERHGSDGYVMLEELLRHIRTNHPEVPIIIDGKRGDIDRTQQQYRHSMFHALGADATNVSPYMGCEPLVDMYDSNFPERGIITLVYTSNKGAREFQDAIVTDPETQEHMPIWLFSAKLALKYAGEVGIKNLGFVMAAAHDKYGSVFSDHLARCRELDEGRVQYLVPGFGAQGGFVEETIRAGWTNWGSLYLSASSSICEADKPGVAAWKLAEQIGEAIAKKPVLT